MSEFFAMGGYAYYVWTSYGFFAVVMIWITIAPILKRRATIRELRDRLARDESRSAKQ